MYMVIKGTLVRTNGKALESAGLTPRKLRRSSVASPLTTLNVITLPTLPAVPVAVPPSQRGVEPPLPPTTVAATETPVSTAPGTDTGATEHSLAATPASTADVVDGSAATAQAVRGVSPPPLEGATPHSPVPPSSSCSGAASCHGDSDPTGAATTTAPLNGTGSTSSRPGSTSVDEGASLETPVRSVSGRRERAARQALPPMGYDQHIVSTLLGVLVRQPPTRVITSKVPCPVPAYPLPPLVHTVLLFRARYAGAGVHSK